MAVAHSLLVVCYHLVAMRELVYQDLGADYFTRAADPQREAHGLLKRLERLGYHVTVQHAAA
jgi:hypothetical protein